ncbi:hypothetical protein BJX96DRAFT_154817 [Aspergillus floccosus]
MLPIASTQRVFCFAFYLSPPFQMTYTSPPRGGVCCISSCKQQRFFSWSWPLSVSMSRIKLPQFPRLRESCPSGYMNFLSMKRLQRKHSIFTGSF